MGQLIRFEFLKMVKKKVVSIGLAAFLLIYVIMLWSWTYGNEWAITKEGVEIYGKEAEAYNDEITNRYAGPLTDEKVQEILTEFAGKDGEMIHSASNNTFSPIASLFAGENGKWNGKSVAEVFPEFADPPVLGQSSRWESLLYSMMYLILMAGIVIIITVSPVFSEEYASGMDALILTAKYGKERCALAKVAAAFLFTVVFTLFVVGTGFVVFLAGRGLAGWDSDIQLSPLMVFASVKYPLKCYEASVMTVLVSLAAMMALNGLTLIFSAVSRTSFISVILAAAVYFAPMFISSGNVIVRKILCLFPVNSISVSGLVKLYGPTLGETGIPVVALPGLVALAVTVICVGFCRRAFANHQVG